MTGRRLLFMLVVVLATLVLVLPLAAQEEVYFPTTEWRTSTPEAQGMDSASLATLIERLPTYEAIDSLVVVRNGYVVAEVYWHPFTRELDHQWMSVSKTVTSALIGIAVDLGYIESLDQDILSYFPEYAVQNLDDNKQAITIRDLLTMRSGLDCDITEGTEPSVGLMTVEDSIQLGLDWRMADAPGMTWRYCGINVYLLMAILERASGMPAMDFAMEHLFTPLGISQPEWPTSQQGIPFGYSGLNLRPIDMARIGYLYLLKGRWEDQQIISADWVEESTTQLQRGTWDRNATYGYLWWAYSKPGEFFTGIGAQGQFLAVYPEENLVVVVASSMRIPAAEWQSRLRISSLIPEIASVIVSDDALPANMEAEAAVAAATATAQNPEPREIGDMPEIATQISGKTYQLARPWVVSPQGRPLAFWRLSENWVVDALAFDFTLPTPTMALHLAGGSILRVPIGMDGVYRTVEHVDGRVAARGQWVPLGDSSRINLDIRFLMNNFRFEMACNFEEDNVICYLQSPYEVALRFSGTASP